MASGTASVTGALDCVVVLCGGRSRRMGRDKARVRVGGSALLERAARAAAAAAPRVLLATGAEARYGELGLERVLDRVPDGGPLAGLEAALERVAAGDADAWVGVLACDMPYASGVVLERCAARGAERGLDAVFLATERGLEPLCGAVHVRALPAVRAALDRGDRRAIAFHAGVRVGTVALAELPHDVAAARPEVNVNTPDDLEGLEELDGPEPLGAEGRP